MEFVEYEWSYSRAKGFSRAPLAPQDSPKGSFVLVRPKWIGICGSDCYSMEVHPGEFKIGHEWVGVVEKKGPQVRSLKIGDVVTSTATWGCLRCKNCLNGKTNLCEKPLHLGSDQIGALRSSFSVLEKNLVPIKGPLEKLKVLHEVIAVAQEALDIAADGFISPDREVLILGGGSVGLLIGLLAKKKKLKPVLVEKSEYRLELLRKKGLTAVALAQALIDKKFSRRFSLIIDASSDFNQDTGAFKYLPIFSKKEFRVVMVGKYVKLPELPRSFYQMSGQIVWMRGVRLRTLKKSVGLWNPHLQKMFDGIITHTFPEHQVQEAFDVARAKKNSMKVVIELQS